TRRKQVNWQTAVHSLQEAIHEAPNWEEVHQLFGEAVDWGELWKIEGKPKKLSNYNILFPKKELNKIVPIGFKVSSNMNNAETGLAIDGNLFTRWTSLKGQEPGMFFRVDLGSAYSIDGFSLFLGSSLNDYPRSLQVLSSLDGRNWQEIQTASSSDYAFSQNRLFKKVHYKLGPIKTQFLRLLETGKDPGYWWSIYELEVFGNKL
ncbi:MAG: discoidin domain-containing protein, partial [Candidatus Aquicultor sp.]